MNLFGFEIIRKKDQEFPSFVEKTDEEGSSIITAAGGSYGTYMDIEGGAKTEAELITKYRELANEPEIEYAIDEVINEAIANDENDVVNVNTDNLEGYSQAIKNKIRDEFDNIKELTDINNQSYRLFRQWYVDGQIYFHVVVNPAKLSDGIQELRYIDPRKIRKVKELKRVSTNGNNDTNTPIKIQKNEYYIYSEKGFGAKKPGQSDQDYNTKALKISKDSIVMATSDLRDATGKYILSYIHKAIRPFNQLRSLENSAVIYALSRAPDRRVFYIDVGNLPKAKAEQYLRDMMVKHKNRLVYDASTGEVRDDRKHMTMLEDYWFPRREGGRSTEVTSLGGGTGIAGQMDNIEYFLQKLYRSLNIPISRLEQGTGFQIGRPSEISRDEIKFQKFISRLRKRFSNFLYQALEKQLILKNIIAEDEWPAIKNNIFFEFAVDNHFTEMKNLDVLMSRVDVADRYREYIGSAISNEFMRKKIFGQTDEEIEQIDKEIAKGKDNPTDMMPFSPGGDFGAPIPDSQDQQDQEQAKNDATVQAGKEAGKANTATGGAKKPEPKPATKDDVKKIVKKHVEDAVKDAKKPEPKKK